MQFENTTVKAKANVYFEGKVVSHAITLADGSTKTLGLIYPGSYHFGTEAPERMEMVAGAVRVKLDGSDNWSSHGEGDAFEIPGDSGFDIEVAEGIAEYVCSFLS